MEKTMTLNLRVNPTVKQQAEDVLKQLGIPMATAPRTFVNSHNRDQEPIPALRLHRFGDIFSPSCYNIVGFFYLCFAIINI